MKKIYETMEAYKVEFNANEQVAAAACGLATASGKYDVAASPTGGCALQESASNTKHVMTSSIPDDPAACLETSTSQPIMTVQYA